MLDKGAKVIQWSQNSLFNKQCWNKWTSPCKKEGEKKRIQLDTDLTPLSLKINSKETTGLNVKHKTVQLLEDSGRETLDGLAMVMTF